MPGPGILPGQLDKGALMKTSNLPGACPGLMLFPPFLPNPIFAFYGRSAPPREYAPRTSIALAGVKRGLR